jgi:hypothetical protein
MSPGLTHCLFLFKGVICIDKQYVCLTAPCGNPTHHTTPTAGRQMAFTKKRSGSENRKRKPIIGFRATESERSQIAAAAKSAGYLSTSSYVRFCALTKGKGRSMRRTPLETVQLAQLLGMVGAAGGALQRLAQTPSAGVSPSEVQAAIADIREAGAAILRALGKRPLSSSTQPTAEAMQ